MKSIDETIMEKLTRISKVLTNISVFSNSKVVRTAAVDYDKYSGELADKIVAFYEKVKSSNIDYTNDKKKKEGLVDNFNTWVDQTYADFRQADPEFNNSEMRPKLESALKSKSAEAFELYNTLVKAPENPAETSQVQDAAEVAQEMPSVDLELDKVFSKFLAKNYSNVRYSSVEAKVAAELKLRTMYAAAHKYAEVSVKTVVTELLKTYPPIVTAIKNSQALVDEFIVGGNVTLGTRFSDYVATLQVKSMKGLEPGILSEKKQEFVSRLEKVVSAKQGFSAIDPVDFAKRAEAGALAVFNKDAYDKPADGTSEDKEKVRQDVLNSIHAFDYEATLSAALFSIVTSLRNKINPVVFGFFDSENVKAVTLKFIGEQPVYKTMDDAKASAAKNKFYAEMKSLHEKMYKILPKPDAANLDAFFAVKSGEVAALFSEEVTASDLATIINAVNEKYLTRFTQFVAQNDGEYTLDAIVDDLVPGNKSNLKGKIFSYLNSQVITAEEKDYEEEYSEGDIKEYTEDYMEDVKDSVETVENFVGLMDKVTKEILSENFLTEEQLKDLGDSVGKQVSDKKGLEDKVVASVNNVLNNIFAEISIEEFREAIKDISFSAEFSKAITAAVTGVSKRFSAPKISIKPDGTIDLDYVDSGSEEGSMGDEPSPFPENKGKPAMDFAPSELEQLTEEPKSDVDTSKEEMANPTSEPEDADAAKEEMAGIGKEDAPVPVEEPVNEESKLEKTFNKYNK